MDLEFSDTVKLLSELFGPNTSLFHKRWKCLNIFKDDQQDYFTFAATVIWVWSQQKTQKLDAVC